MYKASGTQNAGKHGLSGSMKRAVVLPILAAILFSIFGCKYILDDEIEKESNTTTFGGVNLEEFREEQMMLQRRKMESTQRSIRMGGRKGGF